MSPLWITLLLCAVSGILTAGGVYLPKGGRVCGVLTLAWLVGALPILYFLNIGADYVLLFYLASALLGLNLLYGGKST